MVHFGKAPVFLLVSLYACINPIYIYKDDKKQGSAAAANPEI